MLKPKLIRDKKMMACSCGYIAEKGTGMLSFGSKKADPKDDIAVIEKEQSVNTIVDEECPKCKNPKAYTWSQQMRAGDEPETIFFKCVNCSNTWRER